MTTRTTPKKPSTGQPAPQDGHLPSTLHRLDDAITALCEPHIDIVDGQRRHVPSWYHQLQTATPQRGGGTPGKLITECWLDRLMLLFEIDSDTSRWQPDGTDTPDRLRRIHTRKWRPQDCRQLADLTTIVTTWITDIRELLLPERKIPLPDPCPNCGATEAHHVDSAGERVRSPAALQIHVTAEICRCGACKTTWDDLPWLGRILGYDPPAGVLE